jgi:hypothetical protein
MQKRLVTGQRRQVEPCRGGRPGGRLAHSGKPRMRLAARTGYEQRMADNGGAVQADVHPLDPAVWVGGIGPHSITRLEPG